MRPPALATLLLALPLAAHQYPITQATLTVVEGGLRMKLRLSLHHFHPALEEFLRHRITLKDGETYAPAELERYFQGRLELLEGKTVIGFRVVSQDLDPKDLIVVLEAVAPSPSRLSLRHTVLFEVSARQQNLVTLEGPGGRRGFTFDRRHPELPLGR
ncbi:MAG: hypothetical protein HYZ13_11885 [Acidobacteria bacterium]|nr:hypothetical protein [Acidobacteriota bacterium]